MAIQAINFKGENERKQSGGAGLPIFATGAGALVGGLLVKAPIQAKDVLKADKFELSGEGMTPEENTAVEEIKKALGNNKIIATKVAEEAENVFGKEGKEITVDEFLTKAYEKPVTTEQFKQTVTDSGNKVTQLTTDLATAEENVTKATDEASKKIAETARDEIKAQLNDAKKAIDELKPINELVESAKDGKITLDAFKSKAEEACANRISKTIEEGLETLKGKVPKKISGKMAVIGAGIGLVVGLIANAIFAPKKTEA